VRESPSADVVLRCARDGLRGKNRPASRVDTLPTAQLWSATLLAAPAALYFEVVHVMKIRNSLKSLRGRHRANRLVRRKGRVFIINKTNPRYKARQG